MACKNCGTNHPDVRMPCKVCELADNDTTVKRVRYCDTCKAYICADHWDDYIARGIAITKNLIREIKKKLKK